MKALPQRGPVMVNLRFCRHPLSSMAWTSAQEVTVELEPGKTLIIRLLTIGDPHPDGQRTVFFELNGQPREVEVRDRSIKEVTAAKRKADPAKAGEVSAPIPGSVTLIHVNAGEAGKQGRPSAGAGGDENADDDLCASERDGERDLREGARHGGSARLVDGDWLNWFCCGRVAQLDRASAF